MKNIFSIVLLSSSLTLLSGCDKAISTNTLEEAQNTFQEGNYATSSLLLKNILREKSTNIDARILLARNHLKQGLFLNAEKELNIVIKDPTTIPKVIELYFEALFGLNDSLQIIEFWRDNKANISIAVKAKIVPIVSISMVKMDLIKEAKALIKSGTTWAKQSNDSQSIIISEAIQSSFSNTLSNQDKITQLVNGCKKIPNNWVLCYMAANGQFSNKDYEGSIALLEPLVKSLPYYIPPSIQLTESYIKSHDYKLADQFLNALLREYPNQPYINQLKALYSIQTNDFQKAKTHINKTLTLGYTSPETRLIAGLANYQLGNFEQALSYLMTLNKSFPNNDFIKKIIIAIQLKLGNTNSAYNEISQLEMNSENTDIVAMAGIELLKAGNKKQGNKVLENINTKNMLNNNLVANIGISKLASGDESGIEDIERLFESLVSNNADKSDINKSKYLLISAFLTTNQIERAIEQVGEWLKTEPNNIENYLLLAKIHKQEVPNKPIKVNSSYQEVIDRDKSNLSANIHFAENALKNQDYIKANKHYKIALKDNPVNDKALKGLYLTSLKLGHDGSTLVEIEKLLNNFEDSPEYSLTLSEIYLYAKKFQKAIDVIENINFKKNRNKRLKNLILGRAYTSLKEYKKAAFAYEQVTNRDPLNIRILIKLLYVYEKSNDLNKAVNELEVLHKLHSTNFQVKLLLSNYYALTDNANAALTILKDISAENQDQPFIVRVKGIASYKLNKYEEALPFLLSDYKVTGSNTIASYIFDSRIKLNKKSVALKDMKKHLIKNPNNVINRLFYANILFKENESKAIEQYRKIIELDKNNLVSLNNLAWYLYEQNNLTEALIYAQRAKKIAPNNDSIIDTYDKIEAAIKNKL